jgi:hypothetical protein
MSFDKLNEEIENGIKGLNNGVSMGFPRLGKYIGIRKRIMTLIFGASGSGKSAYLHSAYILNPYDELKRSNPNNIKFKVILFSMERSKVYILAKWLSRKIFIEEGVMISIQKMLGWWDTKLTKDEHDLILNYKDYMNELLETVDIVEGPQNPTGIYKYVKNYAEANGKFEQLSEYNKIYIPNHSNEIVIVAEDHLGLTKREKGQNKKEAIDKVSEYNQIFRDQYGYSPIPVSQLNRGLNNPIYRKLDNVEPTIDDVKESGAPGEASDVILSLFDPIRANTTDISYNVDKFVDKSTGANYFRKIKLLKSSYSEDMIGIGMAFHGATGIFKELPKKKFMDDFDYESLFNHSYFLNV